MSYWWWKGKLLFHSDGKVAAAAPCCCDYPEEPIGPIVQCTTQDHFHGGTNGIPGPAIDIGSSHGDAILTVNNVVNGTCPDPPVTDPFGCDDYNSDFEMSSGAPPVCGFASVNHSFCDTSTSRWTCSLSWNTAFVEDNEVHWLIQLGHLAFGNFSVRAWSRPLIKVGTTYVPQGVFTFGPTWNGWLGGLCIGANYVLDVSPP
jgi:hypothetical protein